MFKNNYFKIGDKVRYISDFWPEVKGKIFFVIDFYKCNLEQDDNEDLTYELAHQSTEECINFGAVTRICVREDEIEFIGRLED